MSDPVRNAIVDRLATVTGIGQVHAYERYSDNLQDLADQYMTDGLLCGWFVRRVALKEDREGDQFTETAIWQIRGYRALQDAEASELIFDELIDAIREAFRADWTLGGVCKFMGAGPEWGIQMEESGPVLFAGILCHSVRLKLTTVRVDVRSDQ